MDTIVVNHLEWYRPFALRALCATDRFLGDLSLIYSISDPEFVDMTLFDGLNRIRSSLDFKKYTYSFNFDILIDCLDPYSADSGSEEDIQFCRIICHNEVLTFLAGASIYESRFESISFRINFSSKEFENSYASLVAWEDQASLILSNPLRRIE